MSKPLDTPVATHSDILRQTPQGWMYNGEYLSPVDMKVLKAEAESIGQTRLWKLLVTEGKYHAQKRAMIDAAVADDGVALSILRQAQAYNGVVGLFELFILNITNSK